jgi:hypothetical protein
LQAKGRDAVADEAIEGNPSPDMGTKKVRQRNRAMAIQAAERTKNSKLA